MYAMAMYAYLSFGYVVEVAWVWFIPRDLINYTPTYWESTGLVFIIGMFTNRPTPKKSDYLKEEYYDKKDYSRVVVFGLLMPWFYLLIGYTLKERFFIW